MILPAEQFPAGQPAQLRLAPGRRRKRIIDDRRPPTETVKQVEILRNDTAVLAQRGEITAEDQYPERQRLNEGEPEPFCEGRKQKSLSSLQQKRRLGIGQ